MFLVVGITTVEEADWERTYKPHAERPCHCRGPNPGPATCVAVLFYWCEVIQSLAHNPRDGSLLLETDVLCVCLA